MLEASGLMVFYENMLALNNVSISCELNQIVGVFGANSAGKSTLMYALSGIMLDIRKKEEMAGGERITLAGSIRFEGRELVNEKPSRRARAGIVLCPERRRIFKESTVLENLKIGGYLATPRPSPWSVSPARRRKTRRRSGSAPSATSYCDEHAYHYSGRAFCSKHCADYFFFVDPDD